MVSLRFGLHRAAQRERAPAPRRDSTNGKGAAAVPGESAGVQASAADGASRGTGDGGRPD